MKAIARRVSSASIVRQRDQVVCHDIDRRLAAPGLPRNPGRAGYLRQNRLRGVFTFIGGIGYPIPLVETPGLWDIGRACRQVPLLPYIAVA